MRAHTGATYLFPPHFPAPCPIGTAGARHLYACLATSCNSDRRRSDISTLNAATTASCLFSCAHYANSCAHGARCCALSSRTFIFATRCAPRACARMPHSALSTPFTVCGRRARCSHRNLRARNNAPPHKRILVWPSRACGVPLYVTTAWINRHLGYHRAPLLFHLFELARFVRHGATRAFLPGNKLSNSPPPNAYAQQTNASRTRRYIALSRDARSSCWTRLNSFLGVKLTPAASLAHPRARCNSLLRISSCAHLIVRGNGAYRLAAVRMNS